VPKQQEEAVASEVRTWQSPTGYVPGWASQMEDSTNFAPAARDTRVETSTAAQSSAPAKKWEAYGGYDPKNRRASATPAASFPASPAASVSAAVQARETWPATASTSSGPVSSMPTKKWEPYGGYDPKKRGASAAPAAAAPMRAPAQAYESPPAVVSLASETQSSAPANQWEPYTGYEPKRSSSPAAPTASANAVSQSSDPLSSAPATRWTPPTGYVPSRSRPEQAAEGTKEDASTWSASSMLEGVKQLTTTLFQTRKTTKAPADDTRQSGSQVTGNQDATSKGREIFRILVNTLALSKTLCQVSGANDQEVIKTEQDGAATNALNKQEELFRTLFNCLLLSQTALHQTLHVNGAISNVVNTRGQKKLNLFAKSYPATAREAARK